MQGPRYRHLVASFATLGLGVSAASAYDSVHLYRLLANQHCIGCDLSGAQLAATDLSGTNLSFSDLGGANLARANLWSANLYGANMEGADLTDVIYCSTTMPTGWINNANCPERDFDGLLRPNNLSRL